jgi:thiamine-phosphate pyrophosphorylase
MKLIIISSSKSIEDEAQTVTALFEAGLETFHLRKHKLSTQKMREFLKKIPKHFHNRIVIHSHHNLARIYNLKGIHLTSSHKKKKLKTWFMIKLIKFKNPKIIITTSFTSIGQLFETDQRYNYSYVFLSPIFDSVTSRFQSGFTEHSLNSAIKKSNLKIIARGGVDISSIEKAYTIGFSGLAFYTSIWVSPEPVTEFNNIVAKFTELKIPIE